jgi:DNA repair protein RadC
MTPAGESTPSDEDVQVRRELIRAGQLLKIEVLEHVIVGAGETFTSLACSDISFSLQNNCFANRLR